MGFGQHGLDYLWYANDADARTIDAGNWEEREPAFVSYSIAAYSLSLGMQLIKQVLGAGSILGSFPLVPNRGFGEAC